MIVAARDAKRSMLMAPHQHVETTEKNFSFEALGPKP